MKKVIQPERTEHGQSMVELALTITVLMVLLAGTIDLGRAFFTWIALRDAAQEGASYASFNPTDSTGIEARIRSSFADVVKDPGALLYIDVDPDGPLCLDDTPTTLTVYIVYGNFPISMPFLGALIGDTIEIHATVNDTIILPLCGS